MMAVEQQQSTIPPSFGSDEISKYFSLKVTDNGMAPTVCQNDEIVFRKQQTVENGELAVVSIGDEKKALLRRIHYDASGTLMLTTDNARIAPLIFDNDEAKQVQIHGKVVYLVREITHNCF